MIVSLFTTLSARKKPLMILFIILIVALLAWTLTLDLHHAHTAIEKKLPIFWSLFTIVTTIVLIFFVRGFSKCGIKVREDFYDR